MLAVQISRHGGPDELVPVEVAEPVPAAGQVLVRNSWIGVNYVDLQHREGRPYPVGLPLIPGTEAAGTVVAAGPGADPGLIGAPVVHFGHLHGVYAELTAGRGAGSLTLRWVAASHYLAGQPDRAAALDAVLGQVAAGRLSPRIAARFPLRRASEAHVLLASRTVTGKVLLQA